MKILGVVTSPRYHRLTQDRLNKVFTDEDITNAIHEVGYEGRVSNSQALLLAAMWSAKRNGADVELHYPGDPVPDFDGVVLSTPVYFGDRSTNLHNFVKGTNLKDKAVGIVSSGAKRNGGQETTNIYALYDCLDEGALITGNGPPTAQYGGTGWAGNKTAIVNDDFGIKTSVGTGAQVAKLAEMSSLKGSAVKPNILFLEVNKGKYKFPYKQFKNSNVDVLNLVGKEIKGCLACPVCPNGDLDANFTCIIKDDDMPEIHEHVLKADCVIFVSNIDHAPNDMYQTYMERTRFVRRNHFELAERVYSFVSNVESVTDVFPLRVMTNMLRQNMFGLPFFRSCNGVTNMNEKAYAEMIEKYTKKSMVLRARSGVDFEYTPVGYEDAKPGEKAYRN